MRGPPNPHHIEQRQQNINQHQTLKPRQNARQRPASKQRQNPEQPPSSEPPHNAAHRRKASQQKVCDNADPSGVQLQSVEQPPVEHRVDEQSPVENIDEQPGFQQRIVEQQSVEQSSAEQSSFEQQSVEPQGVEHQSIEHQSAEQQSAERAQSQKYGMAKRANEFSDEESVSMLSDNVSTTPLKLVISHTSTTNPPSLLSGDAAHESVSGVASTAETSLAPSGHLSLAPSTPGHVRMDRERERDRDSESIITLASSSRRIRRRSLDDNCSLAGIAPASIMERLLVHTAAPPPDTDSMD